MEAIPMKKITVNLAVFVMFILVAAGISLAGQSSENKAYQEKKGMFSNMHFSDLDTDGNDYLNFTEFKAAFPSSEQKTFDLLDTDTDGRLNHGEWHRFKEMHKGMGMQHHTKKYHGTDLPDPSGFNAHFPDMDKDNDTRVTVDEFTAYFPDKTDTGRVFEAVDLDRDGFLDHGEWHAFKKAHKLEHMD